MSKLVRGTVARIVLLTAAALALGALGYRLLAGTALAGGTPAFTSLRTDPRGVSVLFGAYSRIGLTVVRSYDQQGLSNVQPSQTVAFVLAPAAWANHMASQLETFADRGGLVVLAAPPPPPPALPPGLSSSWGVEPPETGLDQMLGAQSQTAKLSSAALAALSREAQPVPGVTPAGARALPLLDPATSLKFSPAWTPLFQADGRTYMAMRPVGRGKVILASEATFAANELLARTPDTALLSWLAAGRTTVWVDETLHGLDQSRGVPWLLRRYRLLPAVAVLLLTLGLWIWSVAATLERPPDSSAAGAESVIVESVAAGSIRLLQRAIPLPELLEACRSQFVRWNPRQATRFPTRSVPAPRRPADVVAEFQRLHTRAHKDWIEEKPA